MAKTHYSPEEIARTQEYWRKKKAGLAKVQEKTLEILRESTPFQWEHEKGITLYLRDDEGEEVMRVSVSVSPKKGPRHASIHLLSKDYLIHSMSAVDTPKMRELQKEGDLVGQVYEALRVAAERLQTIQKRGEKAEDQLNFLREKAPNLFDGA